MAATLFALLVLGAFFLVGWASGDNSVLAGVAGGTSAAEMDVAGAAPSDIAPVGDAASVAIKLAPGARLAEKADGTLIVLQNWASLEPAEVDIQGVDLEPAGRLNSLRIEVLAPTVSEAVGPDLEAAASALRLMPGVLWAEVSQPLQASLIPNDPYYLPGSYTSLGQWGHRRVGLEAAWDVTTGSADVIVAVLDTGIRRDAPDFAGRIVSPYSVAERSSVWPLWRDNHGHGTAVAGVAAARGNDGQGMAGAAWGVKIMPVKITDNGASDTTTLATAIEYAVDQGADVINISFSGTRTTQSLSAAVEYALANGVVVVAAAGNDSGTSVSYPGAIEGVIAVGATGMDDKRWSQSNTGTELDLMAPGDKILSFKPESDNQFALWAGTSLSSPLVAGVAALMLSVDSALTPEQITDILASTAEDFGASGWDQVYGWGLLNAGEAVAQAAEGETTTTSSTTSTSTTSTSTTSTSTTSTSTTSSSTTTTSTTTSTTTTSTTTTSTTTTTTTIIDTTSTTSTTSTSTTSTTSTTLPRFADVSEATTPYWHQIGQLASLGVVSGFGDGLFHPEGSLLRQQFAKIVVRACGLPVSGSEICPFVDVALQTGTDLFYPYRYVAVAFQHGITNGTDATHFSPYRTLTRAQMITMVARAGGLAEPPADYKPAFPVFSEVHYLPARAAAYAGLLDDLAGMGPGYDFLVPATRGEVCALIYALLQQ